MLTRSTRRRRMLLLVGVLAVVQLAPAASFVQHAHAASQSATQAAPLCNTFEGVVVTQHLTQMNNGVGIQATLQNNAPCSQIVGLATYQRYGNDYAGNNIYDQQLYSSDQVTLDAGQSVTLKANLPMCAYQADLFYGFALTGTDLNTGARYDTRRLESQVSGINLSYCALPTGTPATSTPTPTMAPPTSSPTSTPVLPTSTAVVIYVNGATSTPAPTYTPLPTYTPAPGGGGVQTKIITITKTNTITKTKTITRYHDVTRVKMRIKTRYVVKQTVRYRVITEVNQVISLHTIVNHKTVYKTVIRHVTVVRYRTKVIVRHVTRVTDVAGFHFHRHPTTGRFAAPQHALTGALPPVEARLSIARLGISQAPMWARAFIANPDGSLRYDIVAAYGVTRFSDSARLGQPGLTLISGHDDIFGSIFRYLGTMRRGDAIHIREGKHTLRYVVTSVSIVTPDDVRLLNQTRTRPTLALISCTPYWVDTHRVVVIAEMR